MDHYNEQLVAKQSGAKDMFIRGLIAAGLILIIFLCVIGALMFNFAGLLIIAAGAVYLAYLLFSGTMVEYEYIVTNDDLDIDKITGKRKRKRLITVKLSTVRDWGEYTGGEQINADATVMASDATGYGAWYMVAEHEKYGTVLVIFTPVNETLLNINFGVPHSVKKKLGTAEEEAETEE